MTAPRARAPINPAGPAAEALERLRELGLPEPTDEPAAHQVWASWFREAAERLIFQADRATAVAALLPLAEAARPRLEALARNEMEATVGRVLYESGQTEAALTCLRAALAHSRAAGVEDRGEALLHTYLGNILGATGRLVEALEHHHAGVALFTRLGQTQSALSALTNLSVGRGRLGDHAAALQGFREVATHPDASPRSRALACGNIIKELMELGDLAEAERQVDELQPAFAEHAPASARAALWRLRALLLTKREAFSEARRILLSEGALIPGDDRDAAHYHWHFGRLQLAEGNAPAAAQSLALARSMARKVGEPLLALQIGPHEVRAAVAAGEAAAALALAEDLHAEASAAGWAKEANDAAQARADALAALDRHAEAFAALREAEAARRDLDRAEARSRTEAQLALAQADRARREAEAQRAHAQELATLNAQLVRTNEALEAQRQAAEEASRLKADLLAIASHDLRNPLTGILGMVETLRFGPVSPDELARSLNDIERAAREMEALLNRFLESPADVEHPAAAGPTPVAEALARVAREFEVRARRKQQRIETGAAAGLALALDPLAVHQILANLVSNALKFSPRGAVVSVLGTPGDLGCARLAVADRGPGLAPEDLPRLFARGCPLTARPTGGESSNGLGLWIVRRLAEAAGGTVAASNRPGGGAQFTVELPLAGGGGAASAPAPA